MTQVSFHGLEPFALAYCAFLRQLDEMLTQVPEAKLDALIAECEQATESNCWWAIYEVAPLVKRVAWERKALAELTRKTCEEARG